MTDQDVKYHLRARFETCARSRGRAAHKTADVISSCPLRADASEFAVMTLARAVYPLLARRALEFFVVARAGRRDIGRVMTLRVVSDEDGRPCFAGEARIVREELLRRALASRRARGAARRAAAAWLGITVAAQCTRGVNFWAGRRQGAVSSGGKTALSAGTPSDGPPRYL